MAERPLLPKRVSTPATQALSPTPVKPVIPPMIKPSSGVLPTKPQITKPQTDVRGIMPNRKIPLTPLSGLTANKQNKYITQLEFTEMQQKSGIPAPKLLSALKQRNYEIEGLETFERNTPMEFTSNVIGSAISLPERTIGGIGMLMKSVSKGIAPDMEQTDTAEKIFKSAENIFKAGEKRRDTVKKRFGERGVRQGTFAGDVGGLATDLAPILAGSPTGLSAGSIATSGTIKSTLKNPKFWTSLGKYIASRGTIGAGEEIAYNVQQEGKILSDKRPYDLAIGTTLEVAMPVFFRALSNLVPRGTDEYIDDIIQAYHRGDKTIVQATAELIERTSPKVDSVLQGAGIGPDVINRVAGKAPQLQEYIDYAHLRNVSDTAPTPRQIAVQRAGEARDIVLKKLNDTGSEIGKIREKIKTYRIGQKAFDNVIDILNKEIAPLNLTIKNGKILRKSGAISGLISDSEVRVLQSVLDDVYRAKQRPNMDTLIQLRDAISNRINFAKKAGETSSVVDGISRKMRGSLKDSNVFLGGKRQAELLQEYSLLKDFLKEVSSYMDTKSGFGVLMKRVLSDKGAKGLQMFSVLKKYTGIDLVDDVTFAKLATELVGNNKQVSLLQQEMSMVAEGMKFVAPGWSGKIIDFVKGIFGKSINNADIERILIKAAETQRPGMTIEEATKVLGDTHFWDAQTGLLKPKSEAVGAGGKSNDIRYTIDRSEVVGDYTTTTANKETTKERGKTQTEGGTQTRSVSLPAKQETKPVPKTQPKSLTSQEKQAIPETEKVTIKDTRRGGEITGKPYKSYVIEEDGDAYHIYTPKGNWNGTFNSLEDAYRYIDKRFAKNNNPISQLTNLAKRTQSLEEFTQKAVNLIKNDVELDNAINDIGLKKAVKNNDYDYVQVLADIYHKEKRTLTPIKGTRQVIDMPVDTTKTTSKALPTPKTAPNTKTGLTAKQPAGLPTKKASVGTAKPKGKTGLPKKGASNVNSKATKETKQEYNVPKEFEETAKVIKEKFNTDVIIDKKKFNEGLKGTPNKEHHNRVLGYVKDGKIYINPEKISKDVLVEEGTHLWYALAKKSNPEIVNMWKNLVSEVRKNKELGALYDSLAKVYDADVLDEEFMAHIIGSNYIPLLAKSDTTLWGKINKFINRIRKWVIDKMIGNKSMIKFSPIELSMLDTKSFLEIISRDVTDPNIRPVDIEIWKSPSARIHTAFDYDEYISDTRFSIGLEDDAAKSLTADEGFQKLQRAVKKGFGQEYNGDLGIVQMAGEHKFRGEEKPFIQQVSGGDIVNKLKQSIKLKIGDFYNLIDNSAGLKISYDEYHKYRDLSLHKLLIQEMREQDLDRLARQYKEIQDYVIADNYKKAAQELRDGQVKNGTAPAYQEIINTIATKQAKSLDGWASTLTKGDDSKKLLSAMLVDDVIRHEIDKAGKKQPRKSYSARPFMTYYDSSFESYISDIYYKASKGLPFEKPNLIGYMEYARREASSSLGDKAITDYVDSAEPVEGFPTIKGRWIRFKDQSEAGDLSKLSAGSSWCIQEKERTKNYLQNSYFDIFVLDDGFNTPAIALRIDKQNDSIGEMRGNLKGYFEVENIPLSLTHDRNAGAKYTKNQHEELNIKYKKALEAHPFYTQDIFSRYRSKLENVEKLKGKQEALNQKYGTPTVDNYESFWEEAISKGYLDDSLQFRKEDINLIDGVYSANDNFKFGYASSPYYYNIAQYRNKNLDFLIREEIKDMKEIGTLKDMSNNQNISILTEEGFASEHFIDRYGRGNGQFTYDGSLDFSKIRKIDGSLTLTKKPKKGEFANLGKVYGMNSKFVMSHDGEYLKDVRVLTSEPLKSSISPKASINFPKTDTDLPISIISYPGQDLRISGAKSLPSADVAARTLNSEDIVQLKSIQVDSLNTPNLEVVRYGIIVKKDFNAPLLKSVDDLHVEGVDISGIKKDAMIKRLTVNGDTKTPKYLSKTKEIVFLGIPETLKEVKGNTSLRFDHQILENTDDWGDRYINSNKIKFKLGPSVRIDGRMLVESAEEFQKYKWVNARDVNFRGDIGESIEIPGTKKRHQDVLDLRETNVSKVKVGVSKGRYVYLPDTVISLDVAESNYDSLIFKGSRYSRQSSRFSQLLEEIQNNYMERVGNIESINQKRSLKGLPPLDPKLIRKSKRTPLEMYRKYKLGEIKPKDINMGDKLREMGNISSIVTSTDSYVDTILRERANILSTVDADTFNQAFASTPPETIRGIVEHIRELRIREGEFSSSLRLKATHFDSSMLEAIQSIGREAQSNNLNTRLLDNEFEVFLLHYYKTL